MLKILVNLVLVSGSFQLLHRLSAIPTRSAETQPETPNPTGSLLENQSQPWPSKPKTSTNTSLDATSVKHQVLSSLSTVKPIDLLIAQMVMIPCGWVTHSLLTPVKALTVADKILPHQALVWKTTEAPHTSSALELEALVNSSPTVWVFGSELLTQPVNSPTHNFKLWKAKFNQGTKFPGAKCAPNECKFDNINLYCPVLFNLCFMSSLYRIVQYPKKKIIKKIQENKKKIFYSTRSQLNSKQDLL